MKKTVCIIISIINIFLLASCEIHNNSTETDNTLKINVESGVMESARKSSAEISKLSPVKTSPYKITIEDVFKSLTGKEIDGSYQQLTQILPDSSGKSYSVFKGEKPFYDMYLNVETVNTGTNIHYETERYSYVSAVFYINDNSDSLTDEVLTFALPENATKQITDLLAEYEAEIINLKCYSLSCETLQSLYDTRKASGTLRDNRYGTGNSTVKNESAIAEKEEWAQADACYYIEGNISLQGVPVFGGEITAFIDSSGIIMLSALGLVKAENEGKTAKIQSADDILNQVNNISQKLYSEDKIKLTDLKLWYYPVDESTYKPLWLATLNYTYTNPDGVKENREAEIWLDAISGEEVAIGGQNSEAF